MEEADLLKERLQAITDKRRIQEDIAKKRRQIEEEKLKLQYIKKKALRDQWLMDGLSQQSEEEQEAKRLQARDEQQQTDQLQSNILSIEKEVEALETQELSISANEEVILKRLKEVERTAEDIIKEIKAEFQPDVMPRVPSPLPRLPPFIPLTAAKQHAVCTTIGEEPKKATFAMEISVEHDKRTGKSQVVSTTHLTPGSIHERGLKVYDDGRKSVYALHSDGRETPHGGVGELSPTEVEEMLLQATDRSIPTGVQYHQPVYSVPYTGSSGPPTPRTPSKSPTPGSSSPFHSRVSSRNGPQTPKEESQYSCEPTGQNSRRQKLSTAHVRQEAGAQGSGEEAKVPHVPRQDKSDRSVTSQLDASSPSPAALVSVKAKAEGTPASLQPVYRALSGHRDSLAGYTCEADPPASVQSPDDFNRRSPFCAESTSSQSLVDALPEELESGPVTMIFMGYENAEDEDEDFQAELVIVGDRGDDVARDVTGERDRGGSLAYHPEGCRSKVFQPKVGVAKVTRCRDRSEDACIKWDELGLHKPTFIHKPGKHSP
ncbi:palmdelphin isoform X4 [Betta splendens]|uniref:Palmdelphin n=1 Tax=Betta splendens TaxID=158456 RepID=A0A6P7M5J2_BETSP|nr:palmdelphin isoform X4 [Betta splendens]